MRDYDPTTGRYLQADPLGLVDGASVCGYARQSPMAYKDPRGQAVAVGLQSNPGLEPDRSMPETLWCARTSDQCYVRRDEEKARCVARHADGEIMNVRACLNRATVHRDMCIRGLIGPPEWDTEEDEDYNPDDPFIPEEGRNLNDAVNGAATVGIGALTLRGIITGIGIIGVLV
jgi:hypothetical protein